MFNVIYRWKLHPGMELEFQKAWEEATLLIRKYRGGLGSRLHKCGDGTWLAYAQWPSQESWEKSSSIQLPNEDAMETMKKCTSSRENPITMTMVKDLF